MAARQNNYEKIIQPRINEIKEHISNGCTEKQIIEYLKISKSAWIGYKHKYSEFNEILEDAQKENYMSLVNIAYKVARGYDYNETKEKYEKDKNGKEILTSRQIIHKHAKPDPGMIQFLLINRHPDEWARDPQVLELKRELLELKKEIEGLKNYKGI